MADTNSPAPIVVIPCSQAKAATAGPARDLYTGSTFRAALRAAATLTTPDRILVLSARHGLLGLDEWVEPYNVRIGQDGSVTPAVIRAQAEGRGIADAELVAIVPSAYWAVLAEAFPKARRFAPEGVRCGSCHSAHRSTAE